MKTIKLPIGDIEIVLNNGSGTITSNLHTEDWNEKNDEYIYNFQIDAIEAMILAHACEGVDVSSQAYVNGIITVVDKISNDFV